MRSGWMDGGDDALDLPDLVLIVETEMDDDRER